MQTTIAQPSQPAAGRVYRAIWRWHFYAGLFVVPIMLMLAITGSIYLFKPQLDRLMYPELLVVAPGAAALPLSAQIAAVQAAYPDATVSTIQPGSADTSSQISISTSDGQALTAFVNPYTAAVLGTQDPERTLQGIALKLHGELLIGTWGDRIIELMACWGLVLMVSGLVLWWPRSGSRVWGVWLPRLRAKRRIFWRDLHVVPGFYAALLVLLLLVTGLPWTGFWGSNFASVWSKYPSAMWDNVPQSTVMTGSLNTTITKNVPWAAEQLPLPQSDPHAEHANAAAADAPTAVSGASVAQPVTVDSVNAFALAQQAPVGYKINLPGKAEGVYTLSAFPDDPRQEMTIHIDQYSGAVLADLRWRDYGLVPKAVETGIALHEGRYFGLVNQLLIFGAALIVILLCVSGVIMWWQRRPSGRLGAPPLPEQIPYRRTIAAITLVFAVAFPLLGASLVAVFLLELLVVRQVPRLRAALN